MDPSRSPRAMSDIALDRDIDRDIARAMAVDPSPEFLARVRTQIADEPAPRAWRISWAMGFAGAAVVAVAIVYAVALTPTRRTTPAAPSQTLAATSLPYVASGFSRTSPYVASAFRRTSDGPANHLRRGFGGQEAGRHVRAFESAISDQQSAIGVPVFDPRETRALQALIAGVRSGRVDLSPLLKPAGPPPMELPPIDDLVIQPLTIDPIAPIDGAQGVRQ